MPHDLETAESDPDVHWAAGYAPQTTAMFIHHEAVIGATRERIFAHLTDGRAWPGWYPGMDNCEAPEMLSRGQMFRLKFFGRDLEVSVGELETPSRFGWAGVAEDLSCYHAWLLRARPQGDTHVVIEVTARGPNAAGISRSREGLLRAGYRDLLARLKELSETAEPR